MAKVNYKELKELFYQYLIDKNMRAFTYNFLKQWFFEYQLSQNKIKSFDNPNVHRLILRELQKEGRAVRIRRNLWMVVNNPGVYNLHKGLFKKSTEEDEFDKYLREKLENK